MTPPLLDLLCQSGSLELEFHNGRRLFKPEKSIIDQKESLRLVETGLALQKLFAG